MWNTFPKEAVEAWEKYCRLFEEEREKILILIYFETRYTSWEMR